MLCVTVSLISGSLIIIIIINITNNHQFMYTMLVTWQRSYSAPFVCMSDAGYAKRYHYCEYFGKYFCPCCHSNDRSYIPGHILRNWNFAKFPVSHFAFDLLKRIFNDPLFSIEASSSSVLLYRKVAALDEMRSCRTQLFHLNAFISTCTRPGRYAAHKLIRR